MAIDEISGTGGEESKAEALVKKAKQGTLEKASKATALREEAFRQVEEKIATKEKMLEENQQLLAAVEKELVVLEQLSSEELNDEVVEYKKDLEYQKGSYLEKITTLQQELKAMKADPVYVEQKEAQEQAKKAEAAQQAELEKQKMEAEVRQKQEKMKDAFVGLVNDLEMVALQWKTKLDEHRALKKAMEEKSKERESFSSTFYAQLDALLRELPVEQRGAIGAGTNESSMAGWFASWMKKPSSQPSFIPWQDKPLRDLRAFSKHEDVVRFDELKNQANQASSSYNEQRVGLGDFADAQIGRWLADDSEFSVLSKASRDAFGPRTADSQKRGAQLKKAFDEVEGMLLTNTDETVRKQFMQKKDALVSELS